MSDDLVELGRAVERDLNNGFPMTCERGNIIQQMADRIEALEAKLAKAVELLRRADQQIVWESLGLGNTFAEEVEAALAELTGGKDE